MTNNKVALITGITGQDGSYLAELLLEKGYEVHGIKRRASSFNTERIDHIYEDPHNDNPKFHLHYGDLTDSSNLTRIISEIQPDEVDIEFKPGFYRQMESFVNMIRTGTLEAPAMNLAKALKTMELAKELSHA